MTTKVENNNKNRHQLADHIVDSMDLNDLIQIVYDDLMAYYEKDTEGFEQDWNDYDLEEADA